MSGFALPAKLAARLADLAAVPARAAPAVAARLAGYIPQSRAGSVSVTASGAAVTVTQARPHGPPIASALPTDGLPAAWADAIGEETGKAMADALGVSR